MKYRNRTATSDKAAHTVLGERCGRPPLAERYRGRVCLMWYFAGTFVAHIDSVSSIKRYEK